MYRVRISEEGKRNLVGNDPCWAIKHWRVYREWERDIRGTPTGLIYFIRAQKRGHVKIGFCRSDVERRLANLQVGSPYKLRVAALTYGDTRTEAELHNLFSYWRLNGEWFNGCAFGLRELIDYINASESAA